MHSFFFAPRYSATPFAVKWRQVIGEFFGTLLFLFFVSASVEVPKSVSPGSAGTSAVITAFLQGFSILALVYVFRTISGGHFNPAVTIATMITRHISLVVGLFFIVAQLLGAIVGTAIFSAAFPFDTSLGATTIAPGVSIGQAFLIEFMITSMLILVVFGTAVDGIHGVEQFAPIPIGLAVLVGVLLAKNLTGASMNPARSFGPAVVSGVWDNHWLYWVAPITAAIFTSMLYKILILSDPTHTLQNPSIPLSNGSAINNTATQSSQNPV